MRNTLGKTLIGTLLIVAAITSIDATKQTHNPRANIYSESYRSYLEKNGVDAITGINQEFHDQIIKEAKYHKSRLG